MLGYFNFSLDWGRCTNLLIFFMSGLPGGDHPLQPSPRNHRPVATAP